MTKAEFQELLRLLTKFSTTYHAFSTPPEIEEVATMIEESMEEDGGGGIVETY